MLNQGRRGGLRGGWSRGGWLLGLLGLLGCGRPGGAPAGVGPVATGGGGVAVEPTSRGEPLASASAPVPTPAPAPPIDWQKSPYSWLHEPPPDTPAPTDALEGRFAPPAGFARVEAAAGSFGAWLRGLPMAAPGTPVRTHKGDVLREASHPYIAGVVAIDVGKGDLQQCADSIIRLHAEWQWSGGSRKMSYRAASGVQLPFERWARGERVAARGNDISWEQSGRAGADHGSFRKYLDMVFNWANTVALSRDAAPTPLDQLRPGDFFIMPGNPGHTVLVVDLARAADGRRVALLGQGFMPAQSFHILKSTPEEVWYAIEPGRGSINTPFWEPFPWSSLRRLAP